MCICIMCTHVHCIGYVGEHGGCWKVKEYSLYCKVLCICIICTHVHCIGYVGEHGGCRKVKEYSNPSHNHLQSRYAYCIITKWAKMSKTNDKGVF